MTLTLAKMSCEGSRWRPFNINNNVRIKITDLGMRAYEAAWWPYGITPPALVLDSEGYVTMHLWKVCEYFGASMGTGVDNPIEALIFFDGDA